MADALLTLLQTPTATPGVGPEELVDYWPIVVRAAWFSAGVVVVIVVGRFLLRPLVVRAVRGRNRNNPTIQEAVARYFQLLVLLAALVVGAGFAGYSRFLTHSGLVVAAATLAVGVAAQTVIGSLISGLVLVLDPEFNIGDYIQWNGGEGTVRSITLRVTRVQTPNGEFVTIPNTLITGQAITRPYGQHHYRVVDRISVAYEDDLEAVRALLSEAATGLDGVLDAPSPDVFVEEFGADAVVMQVHYWVGDPDGRTVMAARSAYAESVKARFEAAGLTISPATKREIEGRVDVG